ncbi:MAG: acyl-CoA dehydrogenase family protein [Spirochaetes bacterium]|nr:acyl-CoA dehydrogenase family protein [Spirochaetota bacterium]
MISFMPSEEQSVMKETLAKLVQNTIKDNAHDMDEKRIIPQEFIAKFRELGTVQSPIPEEYGGFGLAASPIMNTIILEELAAGDMGYAIACTLPSIFINPILECGTDKQKEKYLPALASGECEATLAINEMHFKFDAASPKTTAEKKGGKYILNGEKCYVPLADVAKYFLVAARCENENCLFIVEGGTPGLVIGEREKNLGLNTLSTYKVTFSSCEIPEENKLCGAEGYDRLLQKTRIAMSALGTGVSRASFEYARNYAKERVQFGEPIAHRQAIAFMIAEMAYEVDAMRLMTWKAASALEAGRDAKRESYLAKLYAGEMTMKITDYGVQILGGHGYIREHPVERYYRNGRCIACLEGLAIV